MADLAAMFNNLLDRLEQILKQIKLLPRFRWGVVTSVSPLRIRLDGDENPLDGTPATLVGGMSTGARCYVAIQGSRAVVIGRAGGDTGWKNLPLAPGYVTYQTRTPQYRYKHGVLYLRGCVTRSSGDMLTSGQNVFTNAIPELVGKTTEDDEYNVAPCMGSTGGTLYRVYVNQSAQLVYSGSAAYGSGNAGYMSLSGASGAFTFD